MSQSPANLAWVRTFEAAARHCSLSKAAAELGLSQAAVSLHMRALEAECGCKLFFRNRRGVSLTPQGADYLAMVKGPMLSISSSTLAMRQSAQLDTVTISVAPGIANYWLIPRLGQLKHEVPDTTIALRTNFYDHPNLDNNTNLVIQFGNGVWQGLNAQCLFMDRLTPVCHPDIAQEDWQQLPLISVLDGTVSWEEWFRVMGGDGVPVRQYAFDQFPYAFKAARHGLGVFLAPLLLVKDAIDQGYLVRLSPSDLPTNTGYFLTYPESKPLTQTQTKVAQWLIKQASE